MYAQPLISEAHVVLADPRESDGRIRGYASIVVAGWAVHDLKIIETDDGRHIVQGPARPYKRHCPCCGGSGPVTQPYCGRCGAGPLPTLSGREGHRTVAHPIDAAGRLELERSVLGPYLSLLWRERAEANQSIPMGA